MPQDRKTPKKGIWGKRTKKAKQDESYRPPPFFTNFPPRKRTKKNDVTDFLEQGCKKMERWTINQAAEFLELSPG